MAGENFNARAQFEVDVDKAIRDVNQLTTTLARLGDTAEGKTAQQLSRMEKQTVRMADGLKQVTGQTTSAAAAQEKAASSVSKATGSLANQRYALYDVATTWGVVSAATLGAAAAAARIAIDYQAAFASVQRTSGATGDALGQLRTDLVDLTTELPASFANIAEIATLGGQLGIAAGGLEDFTRVTAQLTATTDLSAEAAGTALGRFQALLGVPASQFENLGSSILKVGVNSAATETQIVNVATQISSMGDFAGLTADQVVGLSGALASVGAQPELARGTVTRTFTLISQAVSEGGASLDKFAQLSGVSAEEFKRAWGTEDFAGIFQDLLKGIEGQGGNAVAVLNDLGITSVRDVPLLLRLAGAQDVVSQSFADAESGFRDGSELTDQYGVVAETAAAKLTILGNTLKAIVDAVGQGGLGPLGELLDVVQGLADAFLALSRNPVGQVFLGLAGAVGVAVGLLAAYRAAQALTLASLFAMKQAQDSLAGSVTKSNGSLRGLTAQMAVMAVGTQRATAAQNAYNASITAGNGRFTALAAGAKGGATAVNGLAGSLRGLASATVVGAAFTALLSVVTQFANKSAESRARIDEVSDTLDQQTGALTDNTNAWAINRLAEQGILETANQLGLNLETVGQAAVGNVSAINSLSTAAQSLRDEFATLSDAVTYGTATDDQIARFDELRRIIPEYESVLSAVGATTREVAAGQDEAALKAQALGDSAADAAEGIDVEVASLKDLADGAFGAIDGTVAVQNALYGLGQSLYDNGAAFDAYSVAGRENLGALSSTISAMVTAAGGDSAALAVMLQGLLDSLVSYGVNSATQLQPVLNLINQLTGGKGTAGLTGVTEAANSAGNALRQGFSSGAGKAAKSAKNTRKEVKTLSDYVRDLEGVFSSAFDFRFGLEQSVDGVADAFQSIVDSAQDAQEAVAEATQAIIESDAKIKGLNAANNTLSYQLTVAQEYGDALRATEIIAEMAQNNADLRDEQKSRAKSEKDLQKAQNATSKSLAGGTVESREQREQVLALVQAYQDQVAALANQGLSQAEVTRRTQELRNQFVAQLTQMGYNRAEVDRYAAAFDDLTFSINNVPRNITVSANTEPAQRALNEFLAKANSSTANASLSASGGGVYNASGINVGAGGIQTPDMTVKNGIRVGEAGRYTAGIAVPMKDGGSVQHLASGGVAGMHPGAPKGVDTVPIWGQPGEFMQRKAAVDHYGLPFMNAINNMQVPKYLATGGPVAPARSGGGGGGIQLVEILPNQIQQIAAAVSTVLQLDGKVLASTVNRANGAGVSRGSN